MKNLSKIRETLILFCTIVFIDLRCDAMMHKYIDASICCPLAEVVTKEIY